MKAISRPLIPCFVSLLVVAVHLRAATITVTNTADSGAGTLRAALASANNGDTINFVLPAPAKITLTSGELLVSKNVNILGPGTNNLAVDGNAAGGIFHIAPSNVVAISSLTATNGNSTTGFGGGIFNDQASLTVSNCVVIGNYSWVGGGIANRAGATNASLTIRDSVISQNHASYHGGGIGNYIDYDLANPPSTASVWIVRSSISSNGSQVGGGVSSERGYKGSAQLTVLETDLNGNFATLTSGGAIANLAGCSASITNSTFRGNFVTQQSGGALFNIANMTVVNSTFSGNDAYYNGGAISEPSAGGNLLVLNSTFNGNTTEAGDANAIYISSSSSAQIGNTLIRGTNSSFGSASTGITSLGFNLCGDDGSGFLTNATDQINTDPLLGPLQDNGGPTFTHAPLPGSPAIDKGKNFSSSDTDQRGFARTLEIAGLPNAIGGDGTDIGAVESKIAWLNNPSVVSNHFGFDLVGPASNSIVVEVSSNVIGTWTALSTNILGSTALRFTDPAAPTSPQRFYRARVP
jgi:hypothetical protein